MAYKSITRRWLVNNLGLILLVLIGAGVAASIAVYQYYYSAVERVLESCATNISEMVDRYATNQNLNLSSEIRNMVQTFNQKDSIEMMAIDHNGEIVVTSSGFPYHPEGVMPDYEAAKEESSATAVEIYRLEETGEKVMALTSILLPNTGGEIVALRYVASVQNVERTIVVAILIMCGLLALILGFILVTSSYFIRSIVVPVQEIGTVARGFARGDMSARILKKSEDEIGELCDIINFMADEMQRSEKMKNEFISSVSHELRTPLTAIKGWSETLATVGTGDQEILHKGMYVITNETERLSNMVEELLDFSRIQDGRFALVKTRMDILAELEDAVLIYTERAKRDNIKLLYSEPEELPFIFGDKNRLKQVFINVIDNALKYSDSGDKITIAAMAAEGYVVIVVSDTGCGISREDLPKVKEKFYKGNSTRRGSGIGLAVATEIVHLHGGDLEITSEIGVGTTVAIRLPVVQKQEEAKTEITG